MQHKVSLAGSGEGVLIELLEAGLDTEHSEQLSAVVRSVINEYPGKHVALDFYTVKQISFLEEMIAAIVNCYHNAKDKGVDLILLDPPSELLSKLRTANLTTLIAVFSGKVAASMRT